MHPKEEPSNSNRSHNIKTLRCTESSRDNIFNPDEWAGIVESLVIIARESYDALGMVPRIEDYYSEEEKYTIFAIRIPSGLDGSTVKYSEIVVVSTAAPLNQKFFKELASEIAPRSFFRYRHYYEELFSRTVFVLARSYRGFVKAIKSRNQSFIPVLGKDACARLFLYLADFYRNRLDALVDSVLDGWKKRSVDHILWRLYRLLKNLDSLRHGASRLSLFNANLYYINILEIKIGKIEGRVSSNIIKTCNALLRVFKKLLKIIDRFLEPIIMQKVGEVCYKLLKERFGRFVFKAIKLAEEYANHVRKLAASLEAEKFLERISRAEPVKG